MVPAIIKHSHISSSVVTQLLSKTASRPTDNEATASNA